MGVRKSVAVVGPSVFVSMIFSKSLLLFLLLPAVVILLRIIVAFFERKKNTDVQYSKKESILTEAEKSFYTVLREVVRKKRGQVRLFYLCGFFGK